MIYIHTDACTHINLKVLFHVFYVIYKMTTHRLCSQKKKINKRTNKQDLPVLSCLDRFGLNGPQYIHIFIVIINKTKLKKKTAEMEKWQLISGRGRRRAAGRTLIAGAETRQQLGNINVHRKKKKKNTFIVYIHLYL